METVYDIVKEMRERAASDDAGQFEAHKLPRLADRIEKAYNYAIVEKYNGVVNEREKEIERLRDENERLRAALQPVLDAKPHSSDQQEHEDMPYYKVLVKCHNAVRKAQEIYKQGEKSDE